MTTATAEKPTKPRNRTAVTYIVQKSIIPGQWSDIDAPCADTAEAMRWIRDHGDASTTYRVVRAGPSVTVTVEKIERRKLA